MKFDIYRFYAIVNPVFRKRRLRKLQALLNPGANDRMLDIGGYPNNWTPYPPIVGKLDILNLQPIRFDPSRFPDHNIQTLVGDGRSLPATDSSYDIVFSNSVIEHLGNIGDQRRFANEARRVGKSLWIQTPAKEFFFEPHYLCPFVHWLPKSARGRLARNLTPWGWIQRPSRSEIRQVVDSIRLLTLKEMRQLFPDCKIYCEKVFGVLTKSYVAWRSWPDTPSH